MYWNGIYRMDIQVVLGLIGALTAIITVLQIRSNAKLELVKAKAADIERLRQQDKGAADTRIKELELRQDETKANSTLVTQLTTLLDKSAGYQQETAVASRQTANTIGESTKELARLTKAVEDVSAKQNTRMEDWDDRTRQTMAAVLDSFQKILSSFQVTEAGLRTLIEGQNATSGKLQQVVDIIEELRLIPARTEAIVLTAMQRIEAIVKGLAIQPVEQTVNVTVEEAPK